MAKDGNFIRDHFRPITVVDVDTPKPPPEKPRPEAKHEVQQRPKEVLDWVPPLVPTKQIPSDVETKPLTFPTTSLNVGHDDVLPPPPYDPPPPPPPARAVEPARAKADLGRYVSDADYPSDAIRREEQGATRFRLAVGPDGRVTGCTVTGSSGSAALDMATCRLMKSRARFAPAHDSNGNAVADAVSSAITWRLPNG
jgi:protein TonB